MVVNILILDSLPVGHFAEKFFPNKAKTFKVAATLFSVFEVSHFIRCLTDYSCMPAGCYGRSLVQGELLPDLVAVWLSL